MNLKSKHTQVLLSIVGFAAAFWVLDSFFCYFSIGNHGTLAHSLFRPEINDVYRRIIVGAFFAILCSHYMEILFKLEKARDELEEYVEDLKKPAKKEAARGVDSQSYVSTVAADWHEPVGQLQKVFFDVPMDIDFACEACAAKQRVGLSKAVNRSRDTMSLRAQCACGQWFAVQPDKRKSDRVKVTLDGYYLHTDIFGDRVKEKMTVKDVSRCGLQMESPNEHDLVPGDAIEVVVKIEDRGDTMTIRKKAIIRTIQTDTLGSEFIEAETRESPLGNYLLKLQTES